MPCEVSGELGGDDLEAMKVSFRETAADVGPWTKQRVVGRVHEAAGRDAVEMTAEQLGVPEETVERNLLIRRHPRHVRLRLKRPWNLTEDESRVLSEAGKGEKPDGPVPVSLCEKLAGSGRFVETAEKDPETAQEIIDQTLARGPTQREAVPKPGTVA